MIQENKTNDEDPKIPPVAAMQQQIIDLLNEAIDLKKEVARLERILEKNAIKY